MSQSTTSAKETLDLAQRGMDLLASSIPVISRLGDMFAFTRSDARKADALLRRAGRRRHRAAVIIAADAKRTGHARVGRTGIARWRELLKEAEELEQRAALLLKSGS